MNYKKQLGMIGSTLAPFMMLYLGYKYTVFRGKYIRKSLKEMKIYFNKYDWKFTMKFS
jgi:hypothetical protein